MRADMAGMGVAVHQRVDVLGVPVSALTMPLAVQTIAGWIDAHARHYVCVTGVHGVMESVRDESLRVIHERAGMVTPDGMLLVWLVRRAGHEAVERVCGRDLMVNACEASQAHVWRHFFYGGAPDVADTLAARLQLTFPALDVVGTYCPPLRE